jgi:hypothetical protein
MKQVVGEYFDARPANHKILPDLRIVHPRCLR